MTVLVVMNDLFFSASIIGIAKKLGLNVELLKDGDVVIRKTKESPVAVIFDLNYAGSDPVGTVRQIKSDPATRHIPLIGFVSHVQVELKAKALEAGCDTVLARSVFTQKLPEILNRAIANEN